MTRHVARITAALLRAAAILAAIATPLILAAVPPLRLPSVHAPCPAPQLAGHGPAILILPGCHAPGAP